MTSSDLLDQRRAISLVHRNDSTISETEAPRAAKTQISIRCWNEASCPLLRLISSCIEVFQVFYISASFWESAFFFPYVSKSGLHSKKPKMFYNVSVMNCYDIGYLYNHNTGNTSILENIWCQSHINKFQREMCKTVFSLVLCIVQTCPLNCPHPKNACLPQVWGKWPRKVNFSLAQ